MIIGLVALVILCGCGGAVAFGISRIWNEVEDAGSGVERPTPGLTASPSPEADDFNRGDCLVNEGTDSDPELRKVPCAAGTLEVLAKIPFTTDEKRCDQDIIGAGGKHDSTYTYDETPGSLGDYVLCMKKR